jgi:hypothetical protein
MKRNRNVILLTLLTLVALVVAWFNHPVRLIIENESNLKVTDISVVIGPHGFDIDSLASGERNEKWFFYSGSDASFHIEGTLDSGKKVELDWGYITHGPGFETIFFEFKNDQTIHGIWNP